MGTRISDTYPAVEAVIEHSSGVFHLARKTVFGAMSAVGGIGTFAAAFCTDNIPAQWCLGVSTASLVYPAWSLLNSTMERRGLHRMIREDIKTLRENKDDLKTLFSLRRTLSKLDVSSDHKIGRSFWTELATKTGWIEILYGRSGQRMLHPASLVFNSQLAPHEQVLSDLYRDIIRDVFGGFLHVPSYLDALDYITQIPKPTEHETLETLFISDPELKVFDVQRYRMTVYNASRQYVGFFENGGNSLIFTDFQGNKFNFSGVFFQLKSSHPQDSYEEIIMRILQGPEYAQEHLSCYMQMMRSDSTPGGMVTRTEKGGLYFYFPGCQVPLSLKEKYDAYYLSVLQNRGILPGDPHHPQGWNEKKQVSRVTLSHLYAAMILDARHLLGTAPDNIQKAWRDFCTENASLCPKKNYASTNPRSAGTRVSIVA